MVISDASNWTAQAIVPKSAGNRGEVPWPGPVWDVKRSWRVSRAPLGRRSAHSWLKTGHRSARARKRVSSTRVFPRTLRRAAASIAMIAVCPYLASRSNKTAEACAGSAGNRRGLVNFPLPLHGTAMMAESKWAQQSRQPQRLETTLCQKLNSSCLGRTSVVQKEQRILERVSQ